MKVCHLLQILAQNHLFKIRFTFLKNSCKNLFVTNPTEVSHIISLFRTLG